MPEGGAQSGLGPVAGRVAGWREASAGKTELVFEAMGLKGGCVSHTGRRAGRAVSHWAEGEGAAWGQLSKTRAPGHPGASVSAWIWMAVLGAGLQMA